MKIKKYDQSCMLIETEGKRILVDPGNINYEKSLVDNEWINIDYILVTHKHRDHCHEEAINTIVERDKANVYTSSEVNQNHSLNNVNIVKTGDIIDLEFIKVEVTKAVHGYLTKMKNGGEVKENIGFIIDDGNTRVYLTSDTINFNNDYLCDVLCMPFNGNGLTMGIIDGVAFAKDINPKLVIPVHMQPPYPDYDVDTTELSQRFNQAELKYKFLDIKEEIEI